MSEVAVQWVAEETAEEAAPQDAPGLLLWADRLAERIHERRTLLAQDAAAEALRRQRWEERQEEARRALAKLEAELHRGCDAMRSTLLLGKSKSRVLPSGHVVAFRSRPLSLDRQDEAALLVWAQRAGLTVTTETPDMRAIRERFRSTGEVPDGCQVTGGDETFSVKEGT